MDAKDAKDAPPPRNEFDVVVALSQQNLAFLLKIGWRGWDPSFYLPTKK
jgi:hypothetical protein